MGEAGHYPDGGPQRVGDAGGFLPAQGFHGVQIDFPVEDQVQSVSGYGEAGVRNQVGASFQRGGDAGQVPQVSVRINNGAGIQVDQGQGEALFRVEEQIVPDDHVDVGSVHIISGRDVQLGIGVRTGMGGVCRSRSVDEEREFLHSSPGVEASFIVVAAGGGFSAQNQFTAVVFDESLEGAGAGYGGTAVGFHGGQDGGAVQHQVSGNVRTGE